MKIAVSACLLGTPCRYDGASKPCEEVVALGRLHTLIPICPEVLGGLPTPRTPCEIVGGRVLDRNGADKTVAYRKGAEAALGIAKGAGCELAVLKAKSPSCGKGSVYDGHFSGTLTMGDGFAAALFRKNGIPVYSEQEIGILSENVAIHCEKRPK